MVVALFLTGPLLSLTSSFSQSPSPTTLHPHFSSLSQINISHFHHLLYPQIHRPFIMFLSLPPPNTPPQHPNKHLWKLGAPHTPGLPITAAFEFIAQQRGWKQGSKTWKRNWNACMNDEYDRLIGYRTANLATWQELCAKVGLNHSFTSINQCKKALALVHVNLVDLLDCWNSDYTPTRFKSKKALAAYTEENHKFFGRDIAKQDKVLRVLLRKLL
ncbi:unnamed protein product [Penicillium nalgiovense]|nr:unnamed protein product [Penicillium nalgiovense]